MTDDEIGAMAQPWPEVDVTEWRAEVFRLIHQHSMTAMLESGGLDVFDVLAVAQILAHEKRHRQNEQSKTYRRKGKEHERLWETDWTTDAG